MAEDKRIRVSTDASGVQALRQNIAQFYADIEGKSRGWRQMAESDIDAIYQKWEKLIQLRNSVQRGGNLPDWRFDQMVPEFGQADARLTQLQQDRLSFLNNTRISGVDVGGGGLLGFLRRISIALERRNRNEEQSIAGGRRVVGGGGSGSNGSDGGIEDVGGRRIDWQGVIGDAASGNIGGMISKLGGSALIGVGAMAMWRTLDKSFQTASNVYRAGSSLERQVAANRFWDFLPWERTANEADDESINAYKQNLRIQYMLGSIYGVSSDKAFLGQLSGSFRNDGNVDGGGGRVAATTGGMAAGGAAIGAGLGSFVPVVGTGLGAILGGAAGAIAGLITSDIQERNIRLAGSEIQNFYSYVLGKNITEAGQDIYGLKRAGVRADRTSIDDIVNAMVGQKIYNLDMGSLTGAAGVTRFGTEGRGVGSIASAFEKGLRWSMVLGEIDPNELGVRLQESLDLYTKMAQGMLGTRGSFNQSDVIGTINALLDLGFEGQQLERLSAGLMGVNGGGQGTFAKALRLQAASQTGASDMLSLQAALEAPSEEMNKKLMSNLWRVSGGDEAQFGTLLMQTFGLGATDVQDLLYGKIDSKTGKRTGRGIIVAGDLNLNKAFEGLSTGDYFSAYRAAQLTTELERSQAGTENYKMAAGGAMAMEGELAGGLKDIADKVDKLLTSTLNVKIMNISDEVKRSMFPTVKIR